MLNMLRTNKHKTFTKRYNKKEIVKNCLINKKEKNELD